MSGQLNYAYKTPVGSAGSLFDISPYTVDSRVNGESANGTLKFGMGVVQGDNPGTDVKVPTDASTAEQFEGVVLNGYTNEISMTGELSVSKYQTVGVLRWGKAWVRTDPDANPAYGEAAYLIIDGDKRGLFTNSGDDTLAINGRFIGVRGSSDIAPVEIYNQKLES